MPTTLLLPLLDFETFLRACCFKGNIASRIRRRRLWDKVFAFVFMEWYRLKTTYSSWVSMIINRWCGWCIKSKSYLLSDTKFLACSYIKRDDMAKSVFMNTSWTSNFSCNYFWATFSSNDMYVWYRCLKALAPKYLYFNFHVCIF